MIHKQTLLEICDVTYAMSIVGGKWKMSMLWELRNGPQRLSELRRAMPGVSESVLIIQLKELCSAGVLVRKDYGEVPPKVTYELSDLGNQLLTAIADLEIWGKEHRMRMSRSD